MRKVIKVIGKVQGVWFRASAKAEADRLGIYGFVRNEPDGSVYIEAEGNDDAMKEFLQWCHDGPQMARVDEVMVEDLADPVTPMDGEFVIQR